MTSETPDYSDRLPGPNYLWFLGELHGRLKPKTYLEIGVRWGEAFALASCPSIGIDPTFEIKHEIIGKKPLCLLFQETSDSFFEHRDPKSLLGRPIDLAFLDGMHHFEFLLRDFINMERHCGTDGIVLMHDCLPPHISMTTRDEEQKWNNPPRHLGSWTGDVWKLIPVLKRYRPDLCIEMVDCEPTGMVMVTRLDRSSRILLDSYNGILAAHAAGMTRDDTESFDRYWAELEVLQTEAVLAGDRYNRTEPS